MQDPHGKGERYGDKTLFALVEHYITPSPHIETVKVKEKAIEFLTNCCAIWYKFPMIVVKFHALL